MYLKMSNRATANWSVFLSAVVTVFMVLFLEASEGVKQSDSQFHKQRYIHPPTFYYAKNVPKFGRSCGEFSPEVFYNNIAHPSLSLLYHRGQALFGILMDKIEASYNTSASDFEQAQALNNETREQWAFIANTVSSSWDSAIDRLETEWEYFILINDLDEKSLLPWEIALKLPLIHERLSRVEYGYLMIEAVVRTGIKEIVGTLQHQLGGVIRRLEEEVAKLARKDEDVTSDKLLQQMKQGFSRMKPSFASKLMEKVVTRSLDSHNSIQQKPDFVSEALREMAILFHAYREKGSSYSNFWNEMSSIFEKEFGFSIKNDEVEVLSKFVQNLNGNQDHLISLIVQIFSKGNKK